MRHATKIVKFFISNPKSCSEQTEWLLTSIFFVNLAFFWLKLLLPYYCHTIVIVFFALTWAFKPFSNHTACFFLHWCEPLNHSLIKLPVFFFALTWAFKPLVYRCFRICSNWTQFHTELIYLKGIFQKNSYPKNFIDKCFK